LPNTSYREIVYSLREYIAKKQLGHERLTVSEIAEQVGYSDARAFRRAFKKWTGMNPEMFRKQVANS
jgi:YesN/AraC family two-component response regulator